MTTFNDIFKRSFLDGFSNSIMTADIVIALCITCALALYIFFVYRLVTRKTFYSKSFNITLAALSVITASIILTIQSSIVISLGMVGALSIVRFRTAVKDPMDLMFLFWSISIGIICGAGLAEIAIIMSLVLTAGVFILDRMPVAKAPKMIIVNTSAPHSEDLVMEIVKKYCRYYQIKSRNISANRLDMVIEVRLAEEKDCIGQIAVLDGMISASLLSHDGEVTF